MKRAFAIAVVVELVFIIALFHSGIRDFLWAHPWWHSFLVAIPVIAVPILAWFELRHSGEANTLRAEANEHRAEANRLRDRIVELTNELDTERNRHLQQIADNTKRPVTLAEKNAETLRKHLRAKVTVAEEKADFGTMTPEIVEVSDDNIVTLFVPRGYTSSIAWCFRVQCGELEITEIPHGSCPLRLKSLKRYGPPDVRLGEITRWEDRDQPAAIPAFAKGDSAYNATFVKPGSPERRTLSVFTSRDGANSFMLEASTGETATGNNVEISKRYSMMYVEFRAAGFTRSTAGTGVTKYPLFIAQ